jgi:type II secretory pathway predicted ATPase ExeA
MTATIPTSDPAATPTGRPPWVAHFGFAKTPFTKRIAARDLLSRTAHAEAVARIGFCVAEAALGVICGEVGAGKTVAVRAATAALDRTRYQVIYI